MKHRLSFSAWLLAGMLLTALFSAQELALSQTVNGRIVGTVTDPSQGAVPGAKVTATNVHTNQTRDTLSNDTGDYVLPALPLGEYEIRAELAGFKTAVRQNIPVRSDQPIRVDMQLQVGEVTETLTVTGAAPVLQADSSDMRNVVGAQELTQLPVLSRLGNRTSFDQFLFILPGTVRGYAGGIPVVGGAQGVGALSYSVDGVVSDNVLYAWGLSGPPSLDAVQTLEVKTNAAAGSSPAALTFRAATRWCSTIRAVGSREAALIWPNRASAYACLMD